jgi:hypothetical protein
MTARLCGSRPMIALGFAAAIGFSTIAPAETVIIWSV